MIMYIIERDQSFQAVHVCCQVQEEVIGTLFMALFLRREAVMRGRR